MTDDEPRAAPSLDHVEVRGDRETDRWLGLAGATLATAAFGLVTRSAGLLLVAGVGVALVAYGRVASPPPVSLALERRFDPPDPGVGERVAVELTVANVGDRTIPDLRLADGVPDGLRVTDGDARAVTALRPGATATLEYEVAGGRARCSFDPAHVASRDVVGVVERRARVAATTDALTWPATTAESVLPLVPRRLGAVGPLATDEGGEGLAFHAVREHRSGDPLSRVDWNRRAKTGEFATVEYQRERAATVVIVVDARPAARLAPADGGETAVDRSLAAASALVAAVDDAGHRVGLGALGTDECWLPPGRGAIHRERLQDRLADGGAFTAAVADGGGDGRNGDGTDASDAVRLDRLLNRLPGDATVVFLSPLCDAASDDAARRLAARTRAVTALSPDVTGTGTTGQRLVSLERSERIRALRARGIRVLDWGREASLERLLARAEGSA